ncbi:PEP-CTERM sorting domain-containing protein [Massilia sp. CCM 8695]|uniref:PEP-CTERM sorting domain-containing protein n=2 Tax=Massilia frigida TaxID=2609281 RepID=A0ABX0NGQ2_9BURK|nr:PEP-CTERM sorting domain-containing protein [Massilia frigida]
MVSAASLDHSVPLDNSYQSFKNENFRTAAFTLSPHTLLIFTGVGTVSQERAGYFRQASSFIGMDGYMWGEPGGYTQQFRSEYRTQAGSTSMNLYGQLRTDERAGQGHLSLHTYAILAEPLTSPVPEPSTYGMLLAGTFLVGAVARRQRRAVARQAA